MEKIEAFKLFVRNNGHLVKHVESGTMTWQKFYEIWDLYGEDNKVWDQYKLDIQNTSTSNESITDIVAMIKRFNVDDIKNVVRSISNVISLVQDFTNKNDKPKEIPNAKEPYQPRAIYRKFED